MPLASRGGAYPCDPARGFLDYAAFPSSCRMVYAGLLATFVRSSRLGVMLRVVSSLPIPVAFLFSATCGPRRVVVHMLGGVLVPVPPSVTVSAELRCYTLAAYRCSDALLALAADWRQAGAGDVSVDLRATAEELRAIAAQCSCMSGGVLALAKELEGRVGQDAGCRPSGPRSHSP